MSNKPKIYIFVGSENLKGKTASFANKLNKIAKKKGFEIVKSVESADGLFIVSPVHWFSAPIKLKKFIDGKLHRLEEAGWRCEGKLFGALLYSPEGCADLLLAQLAISANLMGFFIPPFSLLYYRNNNFDKWVFDFEFLDYWENLLTP